MKNRSRRMEKMARVYDDEILPIWSKRFGRMLLRKMEVPDKAMVLDFGCGTGYPTLEIMERMGDKGRIIAIDPSGPLLDVARQKAGGLSGKRIFFRTEATRDRLGFADDVYDLSVSNVALDLLQNPREMLSELVRVTTPGGQIIITLPLAGTYREFFDIYREVLTKDDRHQALERLEAHALRHPEVDRVVSWLEDAGAVQVEVEVQEFSMLFKSSREFFFAPVIEFGPLSAWKEVAGKGQKMQEVFWHIKESIDAYFGNRGFALTVVAGCFCARKPEPGKFEEHSTDPDISEAFAGKDQPEELTTSEVLDDFILEEDEDTNV